MTRLDSIARVPEYWTFLPDAAGAANRPNVWRSDAAHDPVWDAFLRSTPLGQFQQSSAWARVKTLENWRATRFLVGNGGEVSAGCQILWKTKFGLRVGFVSKGPVVAANAAADARASVALLQHAARRLRLQALIVQPPDFDGQATTAMNAAGFLPQPVRSVFSATVLVDLARPFAVVERGFSHDVDRLIRRQEKRNVRVVRAGLEQAGVFFDLMCQTCARQKVAPNPASAASIVAILREFRPALGASDPFACLLFAEHGGRLIAGFLLIRFGDRLSLWKKGAADDAGREQPNRLLDREAMKWGHEIGCSNYDLVGIDRAPAERLLAGEPRARVAVKSSDYYKLLFGGSPRLLPEARIWAPTRVGRLAIRLMQVLQPR